MVDQYSNFQLVWIFLQQLYECCITPLKNQLAASYFYELAWRLREVVEIFSVNILKVRKDLVHCEFGVFFSCGFKLKCMRSCLLGGSMSYTPPKDQYFLFRSVVFWRHHSVSGHRGDELSDSGVSVIWKRILSQTEYTQKADELKRNVENIAKSLDGTNHEICNHSRYSELRDHADSIHTWPPRSITNNIVALGMVFKTLLHPLRGLYPIICICSWSRAYRKYIQVVVKMRGDIYVGVKSILFGNGMLKIKDKPFSSIIRRFWTVSLSKQFR